VVCVCGGGGQDMAQYLSHLVMYQVTSVHYVIIKYRFQFYWWSGNDLVIKVTSVERNSIN
jgi:hypothetical protein